MAKEEIRPCLVWVLLVRYCWARQKNNTAIPGTAVFCYFVLATIQESRVLQTLRISCSCPVGYRAKSRWMGIFCKIS